MIKHMLLIPFVACLTAMAYYVVTGIDPIPSAGGQRWECLILLAVMSFFAWGAVKGFEKL